MNPLGAAILIVLIAVVLGAPRRYALLGMFAGILYLTQRVQIEVAGINLFATRFLLLAGFIRVVARSEFSLFQWNGIDRALVVLHAYTTVVFLMRAKEGQMYQIGICVDALLSYFIFRAFISSFEDLRWFLRDSLLLLVPYLFFLFLERITRHNSFAILGAREVTENFSRGDKPRCFGTFGHPSLLGTLGASLLPLFMAMVPAWEDRRRSFLGIGICLGIVVASNSGGPLNAMAFGLLGWIFWRYRDRMLSVRRLLVAFIVFMALVMEAPVYYLPARLSSLTGGDGWHRSYLIEQFLAHWTEWLLAGIPIAATSSWFPYVIEGTGGADITNQFVKYGIDGGIGAIILFVVLLTRVFSQVGRALVQIRETSGRDHWQERMMWGLGVVVLVHIATWFGITYFDQTSLLWHLHLAALSSLSALSLSSGATGIETTATTYREEVSPQIVAAGGIRPSMLAIE